MASDLLGYLPCLTILSSQFIQALGKYRETINIVSERDLCDPFDNSLADFSTSSRLNSIITHQKKEKKGGGE